MKPCERIILAVEGDVAPMGGLLGVVLPYVGMVKVGTSSFVSGTGALQMHKLSGDTRKDGGCVWRGRNTKRQAFFGRRCP